MDKMFDQHAMLLTASGDVFRVHDLERWFAENAHRFLTRDTRYNKVDWDTKTNTLYFLYQPLCANCFHCDEAGITEGYCDGHGDEYGWSEMIDYKLVSVWS